MKKINIIAVSILLAAGMLTGCSSTSSEKGSETESSSSSETSAETTQSESTAESSVTSKSDSASASEELIETVNPLNSLAQTALAVGEWPVMDEITDEAVLSDFFLLDKNNENYRNIIVMQCPMSASMSELIIIEAEDTSAAADDLKERRKKAQDSDAFYPDDVEKAKNAIVGTVGDYAYYILSSEPEKSEEALLMTIEG